MCKVSVIIPNYNHRKYLSQRIESVLNQTYKDFELLIMDDCSTDESQSLILKYAQIDRRIKVLLNEKNSGNTFLQWEKGINNTKGDYIWIAESDDFAELDFLNILVAKLDAHPNAGIAYTQSWEIDEDNNKTGSYSNWTKDLEVSRWDHDYTEHGEEELRKYFCLKNTIPNASAVLFKRAAFLKTGGLDTSMKLCGDKMFWTKLLLYSDICFVSLHLNYFRTHRNNVRTKSSSGKVLIEDLNWFYFLKSKVSISHELVERVRSHHYRWWVSLIVVKPSAIFSSSNISIWKTAQQGDLFSFVRIFLFLFNYYFLRLKVRLNKKSVYA